MAANEDVHKDPFLQLQSWWDTEPSTLTCLSTIKESSDGVDTPTCRLIELVHSSFHNNTGGIIFYTDSTSNKAQQFTANPNVALTLFFAQSYRQARVEGTVKLLPKEYSSTYYKTLTRERQIVLHIDHQSQHLASREVLLEKNKEMEAKFADTSVLPVPVHWEAYCVTPNKIELFLSHENWLADRMVYTKDSSNLWTMERLMP